ncbi:MAG: lipoyl synthase [candidate division Zixibacteria bacterium]|nr:lipoyl synthase [candidate division Zixibacteria bacterium]MDH3936091.1 lipoyl synthase [candidate division Zixibacteria bacterium]MDH4032237.1 lipoyl synthase [candidate division Zixibacteria bacterium]
MAVQTIQKPKWLKVSGFTGVGYRRVDRMLNHLKLNTVCQAAGCPNRGECFNRGTATFLILGPLCTRGCRFCNIGTGKPQPVDPDEPARLAQMVAELKLNHVVVTSVNRDDLPDGGATHFARTIEAIRKELPTASIEILTPDFRNAPQAIDIIIDARPEVFNHNVETVPRLYRRVRPGAVYQRSLDLLREVGRRSQIVTKSGLMLGLGETAEELRRVFDDLASIEVSMLTIGQYLAPSKSHLPVVRYVPPEEFTSLGEQAMMAGIPKVVSAPLVRSSYRAEEYVNL